MAGWSSQPRDWQGRWISTQVSSSAIASADYDQDNESLVITFTDGSSYTYDGVPYDEYNGMMNAGSIGQYFNSYIRNEYTFR